MKEKKMMHIWVPEEIGKRYEQATGDGTKIDIIETLIQSMKNDVKMSLESFDDDVLAYKGMVLKYKKAFQEVYENQSEKIDQLWEDIQKTLPRQDDLIKQVKDSLVPILDCIEKLAKKVEHVNTYHLMRMVELIDKVNACDDKTKEVLLKVIEYDQMKGDNG